MKPVYLQHEKILVLKPTRCAMSFYLTTPLTKSYSYFSLLLPGISSIFEVARVLSFIMERQLSLHVCVAQPISSYLNPYQITECHPVFQFPEPLCLCPRASSDHQSPPCCSNSRLDLASTQLPDGSDQ